MEDARLLFRVAETTYALPLEAVVEVTTGSTPSPIPLIPTDVGGVLNVRGEPLPVIDAGTLLRGANSGARHHVIVVAEANLRVGVLVDHVLRIDRGLGEGIADCDEGAPVIDLRRASGPNGPVFLVELEVLLERAADLLSARPVPRAEGEREWPTAF
jgi:hypothetical protein